MAQNRFTNKLRYHPSDSRVGVWKYGYEWIWRSSGIDGGIGAVQMFNNGAIETDAVEQAAGGAFASAKTTDGGDRIFGFLLPLGPMIDYEKDMEFSLWYNLGNPANADTVSFDLLYSLYTPGEGGTDVITPATTTGVTDADDLVITTGASAQYCFFNHNPFTIAGDTFSTSDIGKMLGLGFKLVDADTTLTGNLHLVAVLLRYVRAYI
ncbi:MAG: hypothetical protein GF355_09595 [Candidatus Eisenbacteria bacterium]|nr:hypothetical protein [Candidatus Eisenbacteria bacterium]